MTLFDLLQSSDGRHRYEFVGLLVGHGKSVGYFDSVMATSKKPNTKGRSSSARDII